MSTSSLSLLVGYAHNAALEMAGLMLYAFVKPRFARFPDWLRQVLEGVCFALLIGLSMAAPLRFADGVTVNLRSLLVCFAVVFGGPICGLIAGGAGIALRAALGGNSELGLALVVLPYALGFAYRSWAREQRREIGYVDLLVLGMGIDLSRVLAWLIFLPAELGTRIADPAWLAMLVLVPITTVLLGAIVLLVEAREDLVLREAIAERHKNALLEAVNVTRTIDRPLRENIRALTEIMGDTLDVERTALFLADFEAQVMEGIDIWQRSTRSHLAPVTYPMSATWDLEASRRYDNAVTIEDVTNDPRVGDRAEIFHQLGIRSVMQVPIFAAGRYMGALTCAAMEEPRKWNAKEVQFARSIGDLMAFLFARDELARREAIALRHKSALLEAVNATHILDRPLLDSIRALTEIAGNTLAVDRTSFFALDDEGQAMERIDLWERSTQRHLAPLSQSISLWRLHPDFQRENVVAVEDALADSRLAVRHEHMRADDIRAVMWAPVFADGRYRGTMVCSMVKVTRKWTSEEMVFMRSIADLLALLLAHERITRREKTAARYKDALVEAVHVGRLDRPFLDAIHALTEIAGEALGVERTALIRSNAATGSIERLDLWERSKRLHGPPEAETGQAMWHLATKLQHEGIIALDDVDQEPRLAPAAAFLRRHDMRSLLMAQIFTDESYSGILGFATVGTKRRWTSEDMHFARSIADLLSLLLVTSQHRESLAALDLIDDGLYIEGEDGRVVYANGAALRMAGYDRAGDPKRLTLALPSLTFPRPARPLTGERDSSEAALDLAAGHRDLRIDRNRLPGGGIIVLVHDMTQRRAAERERVRLERQLLQAHRLEAIGQMAGGIAHDFNNLLGAIGGFARFLEEDLKAGSDEHQYARRILSACERGKALVAQILSFAKMRNIGLQPIDLHALLEASRDLLTSLARPLTTFTIDIADAPMPVLGNDAQVTQLLVNLCANAVDALGDEPGTVNVRARRIARGAGSSETEDAQRSQFDVRHRRSCMFGRFDPERDYVRIDVSDSGKGIPAHLLPRIFEPFFTTKHRYGGTGLGLAVVQSVVTYCDGVLYVDSVEGRGTTFSVYLPVTDRAVEAPAARPAKANAEGGERVLIVDDDMDVADMLSIGLGRFGYEVATLNDPAEALAAFSEDPGGWDVAVIDRVMPEMDGIALANQLRAIRRDLRVILCTALDDGSFDSEGDAGAFDLYYTKPVAPEQIAGGIRALFAREHT